MNEYLTVDGAAESRLEINRSVFICTLTGISSYAEGLDTVKAVSKKYSDATHNCYAMRLADGSQKFSDDGEPNGTAGQPILQALKNRDIYNVLAVVTRYFGGIKLGASGLTAAYMRSASEAVQKAKTVTSALSYECVATTDYTKSGAVLSYIKDSKFLLLDTVYGQNVNIKFAVPVQSAESAAGAIAEITLGKAEIIFGKQDYYKYE